jgi:multisubunit Na+/H+ antiporter MnhC subunit
MIEFMICIMILLMGLLTAALRKDLIKSIIGVIVMEYGVVLQLLFTGRTMLDPHFVGQLAQAMLVAGAASVIVFCVMAVRIYERTGTTDMSKIRKLKG